MAVVLGAGNVTALGPADCVSQIFEHGRAALLKLHPLHAPLEGVLREALAPLVEEGLLAILTGGPEVARDLIARPEVGHVHLTGGSAAFESLVWDGRPRSGPPVLQTPLTCELGNVSPWVVIPGRYSDRELVRQADTVAASIVNNTSFNCIATKLVVTAGSWDQRDAFLAAIRRRLAAAPARPAWYPGSTAAWEAVADRSAPADGSLPWVFRSGVDPDREPHLVDREWFVPLAVEVPLAADSLETFCGAASGLLGRLPGSLAASVTLPGSAGARDARRAESFVEHLRFGVVAVNTWSALGYSLGSLPWGGFPGGTLAEPKSGIGFVHDPLLLPLVHHSILRGPLFTRMQPAWFPWNRQGERLARGLVDLYGSIARGKSGLWPLARMLPTVLVGA
jgi:acyl-CoA reductase-like NAD-dependent aldehyde dehydrogenase